MAAAIVDRREYSRMRFVADHLMERTQLFDLMAELKLYGMKAAFDEIMATAVKRQHEPQRIVGDLLIKRLQLEGLLPGVTINTSATDFAPIKQFQLRKFKGERWELFGDVISSEVRRVGHEVIE